MQPLKQKKEASVIAPTEHVRRKPDDEDSAPYDVMQAVSEDLIKAIHAHDVPGCAEALRAAFELSESEPPAEDSQLEGI